MQLLRRRVAMETWSTFEHNALNLVSEAKGGRHGNIAQSNLKKGDALPQETKVSQKKSFPFSLESHKNMDPDFLFYDWIKGVFTSFFFA